MKRFLGKWLGPQENTQVTETDKTADPHTDYVNAKNKKGKTALHVAVAKNNIALVKALTEDPLTNVKQPDDVLNTPLHIAATKPTADATQLLIAANTSLTPQNSLGETPLHLAVQHNSVENVAVLLKHKANPMIVTYTKKISDFKSVHSTSGVNSPLHYAFNNKDQLSSMIIDLLLNAGADVNLRNQNLSEPIHLACEHPKIKSLSDDVFKKFLSKAEVTHQQRNRKLALHLAAGNTQMPAHFFSAVLDQYLTEDNRHLINATDYYGNTPLYYAVASQNLDRVILLLRHSADPNIFSGKNSLLHVAVSKNHAEIAGKLIAYGAKVNAEDEKGRTPLILAAENGNVDIIQWLQANGASFEGQQGELAVKKALLNNHPEALLKLIEYGANPDVHVYPKTHSSKTFYSTSLGSSLVDSSSKTDGKDKTYLLTAGDTPLHFAVKTENEPLVIACLQKNSSMVNTKNDKDKTPAHFAIKILSPKMAYLLYSKGVKIEESIACTNHPERNNTLLKEGAARGFVSEKDINDFFENPHYQLTPQQLAIKMKMTEKYAQPPKLSTMSLLSYSGNNTNNNTEESSHDIVNENNNNDSQSTIEIKIH